jgi:GT2 family glycosyltransferase
VGLLGELTPAAPVIVVDNGSQDGTADAVAAGYPRVRLVRSRSNLGALGRNLAVRGVQTRYVG